MGAYLRRKIGRRTLSFDVRRAGRRLSKKRPTRREPMWRLSVLSGGVATRKLPVSLPSHQLAVYLSANFTTPYGDSTADLAGVFSEILVLLMYSFDLLLKLWFAQAPVRTSSGSHKIQFLVIPSEDTGDKCRSTVTARLRCLLASESSVANCIHVNYPENMKRI